MDQKICVVNLQNFAKAAGLLVSLMKKFRKDKHFHPSLMELETAIGTLLELMQDDETSTIRALTKHFQAFLYRDPCTGSCFVVLIHNLLCQLSFARTGDEKWTWLPQNTRYRDCMDMDGPLYASTSQGEIDAFDLTAPNFTMKVIMDKIQNYTFATKCLYIIRSPWGDLLQVRSV